MKNYPIDHIAVVVPSILEAAPLFELVAGESCSPIEEIPSQAVNVAFVGRLELLEPTDADSGVARFLQRRGTALHHIAYRVPDINAAVSEFREKGLEPIDAEPRRGARGHLVVFLDRRSTHGILIELVQDPAAPS